MVPEHARYNQQHGAHYLSSVLSLGTSLGLVMMDPVCVWEMFQKKCGWTAGDGAGESVGRAVINSISFQSRSQAALLHPSHITHTELSPGFLPPVCLHRPSLLKKEAVYTQPHSSGLHSQSRVADRLEHFIVFELNRKNRKLWKVWHRRTPSEEHRHRRRVVLSRVAVCAIQKSVRWLDWWRIKISLLLKEHVYGLRFPQSTGSPP